MASTKITEVDPNRTSNIQDIDQRNIPLNQLSNIFLNHDSSHIPKNNISKLGNEPEKRVPEEELPDEPIVRDSLDVFPDEPTSTNIPESNQITDIDLSQYEDKDVLGEFGLEPDLVSDIDNQDPSIYNDKERNDISNRKSNIQDIVDFIDKAEQFGQSAEDATKEMFGSLYMSALTVGDRAIGSLDQIQEWAKAADKYGSGVLDVMGLANPAVDIARRIANADIDYQSVRQTLLNHKEAVERSEYVQRAIERDQRPYSEKKKDFIWYLNTIAEGIPDIASIGAMLAVGGPVGAIIPFGYAASMQLGESHNKMVDFRKANPNANLSKTTEFLYTSSSAILSGLLNHYGAKALTSPRIGEWIMAHGLSKAGSLSGIKFIKENMIDKVVDKSASKALGNLITTSLSSLAGEMGTEGLDEVRQYMADSFTFDEEISFKETMKRFNDAAIKAGIVHSGFAAFNGFKAKDIEIEEDVPVDLPENQRIKIVEKPELDILTEETRTPEDIIKARMAKEGGFINLKPGKDLSFDEKKQAFDELSLTKEQQKIVEEEDLNLKDRKKVIRSTSERAVLARQAEEVEINKKSEKVINKIKKLNPQESKELANYFEQPDVYSISPELDKKIRGGEQFRKDLKELNEYTGEKQKSKNIIEKTYDDETFLTTLLEKKDGSPLDPNQLEALRKNKTFIERLRLGTIYDGGGVRTKSKKTGRKFENADERDAYFRDHENPLINNIQTKRSIVDSVYEHLRVVKNLVGNRAFVDKYRADAKNKRIPNIFEAYDPEIYAKEVKKIKSHYMDTRTGLLSKLKGLLTDREISDLKTKLKEDIEKGLNTDQDINKLFDDVRIDFDLFENRINAELNKSESLKKKQNRRIVDSLLKEARTFRDSQIEKIQAEITKRKADIATLKVKGTETENEGFRDLGDLALKIPGAHQLRGIMVNERDFRAMEEIHKSVRKNGFTANMKDIAQISKFLKANFDLYELPQAIRAALESAPIAGYLDIVKALGTKDIGIDEWVNAARIGVFTKRELDTAINFKEKMRENAKDLTSTMRFLVKSEAALDKLPFVKAVKDSGLDKLSILNDYQFEHVVPRLKVLMTKRLMDNAKAKAKKKYGKIDENILEEIETSVASYINNTFRGQNWELIMAKNPKINKDVQQKMRAFIFASDYLYSTAAKTYDSTIGLAKGGETKKRLNRKALAAKVMYHMLTAQMLSYAINGHSTFENEDNTKKLHVKLDGVTDEKGNQYYLDTSGNWAQPFDLLNRPAKFLQNKLGGPARVLLALASGGDRYRNAYDALFDELNMTPFSLRQIGGKIINEYFGDENKFGLAETIQMSIALSLSEFFGAAGTFSGEKNSYYTGVDVLKELKDMITGQVSDPAELGKAIAYTLISADKPYKKKDKGPFADYLNRGSSSKKKTKPYSRRKTNLGYFK